MAVNVTPPEWLRDLFAPDIHKSLLCRDVLLSAGTVRHFLRHIIS